MIRRIIAVLLLGAMLVGVTGCVGTIGVSTLTPKIAPPVIGKKGVLRAAVDLGYPPFAGTASGQRVGLDVDVAAAVAEQLGLKLELVDASSTVAATLVDSGGADVVLGGLTVDAAVASQLAFAGTYVSDAPAVFAAKGTTTSVDALGNKRIAVQTGSLAYWDLLDTYGEAALVVEPSLDQAFKAVVAGKADVAAGDAIVGSYILRNYPKLSYLGQIGGAYPIGIGVSQQNTQLETQVRSVLDKLASQGVLETLRHKWAGDLPPLKVPEVPSVETSGSLEASGSLGASGALVASPTP